MSPEMIFKESNVRFDFSRAIWATDKLHQRYQSCSNSLLKDVDFIVETQEEILFVEIKNSAYPSASHSEVFENRIKTDTHYLEIAGKYYHSVLYPLVSRNRKKYVYLYILEGTPKVDDTLRKWVRNKITKYLPRNFPTIPEGMIPLIDDFQVLSIDNWNETYTQYPIERLY